MDVRRILGGLKITKIAAVDRPCQEGALVTIMKRDDGISDSTLIGVTGHSDYDAAYCAKRDFSANQRKKLADKGMAMKDGAFPIENEEDLHNAIRLAGNAKKPDAAKAHIKTRAAAMGLSNLIPSDWKDAVAKKLTLWRGADGSITLEHKPELGETAGTTQEESAPDPKKKKTSRKSESKNLKKSVESILADSSVVDKAEMISKSIDEFENWFEKAVTEGVTVEKGADAHNEEADMADKEKDAEKMKEDMEKALVELKTVKRELVVAKMTPEHREYFEKAADSEDKKDKFAEADMDKRAEIMKSAPIVKAAISADIQKRLDEAEVQKREFDEVKKTLAEITKRETDLVFAKRATDLGFKPDFGSVLQKAYAGDAESIKKMESEIVALRKQADSGGLFKNFGAAEVRSGSALEKLNAQAEELRKTEKKLTKEQAFTKVYTDPQYADLAKAYRAETRAN